MSPRSAFWIVAVVHLVSAFVATRLGYGWHRDEMYYADCGAHPALGYVDQPLLAPLIARAVSPLGPFGTMLAAGLFHAGTVALAVATAARLGATEAGRGLTALVVFGSGAYLGAGAMFGTVPLDLFATALAIYGVVRLREGEGAGAFWLACAIGPLAKLTALPALFLLGLAAARRRETWVGGGIALLAAAPMLVWQAGHGWPMREFAAVVRAKGGSFLPDLLVPLGPAVVVACVAAARSEHRWTLAPALAGAAIFGLSGGKGYYAVPLFLAPAIAGASLHRRGRWPWVGAGVTAAVSLPFALPVLPPAVLARTFIPKLNPTLAERTGWPEFVATVAGTRPRVVVAANYGEAGALSRAGIPVVCGHNSWAYFPRPTADLDNAVVVGHSEGFVREHWREARVVARARNPYGLPTEEEARPVWRVRGFRGTVEDLRHVD